MKGQLADTAILWIGSPEMSTVGTIYVERLKANGAHVMAKSGWEFSQEEAERANMVILDVSAELPDFTLFESLPSAITIVLLTTEPMVSQPMIEFMAKLVAKGRKVGLAVPAAESLIFLTFLNAMVNLMQPPQDIS